MRAAALVAGSISTVGCDRVFGLDRPDRPDGPDPQCTRSLEPPRPFTMARGPNAYSVFANANPIDSARSQAIVADQPLWFTYHRAPPGVDELQLALWDPAQMRWQYDRPFPCDEAIAFERSPALLDDGSMLYLSNRGDAHQAAVVATTRVWRVRAADCTAAPPSLVTVMLPRPDDEVWSLSHAPQTGGRVLVTIRSRGGADDLWEYRLDGEALVPVRELRELNGPCSDAEAFATTGDVIVFSSQRLDDGARCGTTSRLFWAERGAESCDYQEPVVLGVPASWIDVHDPVLSPGLGTLYAAIGTDRDYRIETATR